MKEQFIAEHRQEDAITPMCRVREGSVSGYSAWRKPEPSQHARSDAQLPDQVKMAFQANRCVYGSSRVHAQLPAQGIHGASKRVARLMREQGLFAQRPRHRTITTQSEPDAQAAPNLLQRDFRADEPNTKWGAETTSIWTAEGWLLLAVVLDLFSRMVVGWSMAAIQDATLVINALHMAMAPRHPEAGLLHHTDRGSTYTSQDYQALLQQEGMVLSRSRTADGYDNAARESFFQRFKGEGIDGDDLQTRAQARSIPFAFIECFDNRTRRHSTLHSMSPLQYEHVMCSP